MNNAEGENKITENPTTIADMRRNGVMVGMPVVEDKEGIEAMYKLRDEAHARGDWDLLLSTVEFPYIMVSDTSDGNAVSWGGSDPVEFNEVTDRVMKLVPKGPVVEHHRSYTFITSNLAINHESNVVTVGKEKLPFRAAHIVVKRDGKWRVKSVIEGGWGDLALKTGSTFEVGPKGAK